MNDDRYVWLVVRRRRFLHRLHSGNDATPAPIMPQRSIFLCGPSFLARDDGDSERNALRDLAWRGFSNENRKEVYRGVAFATEFLSSRRSDTNNCGHTTSPQAAPNMTMQLDQRAPPADTTTIGPQCSGQMRLCSRSRAIMTATRGRARLVECRVQLRYRIRASFEG